MKELKKKHVRSLLKSREISSNKSDHGHAFIIAGSKGFIGAAVIAAKACIRSGAGLLTLSVPGEERLILQTAVPEAMLLMREENLSPWNKFSAIGIGPGIGTDQASGDLLNSVIEQSEAPLVLDADALTILSNNNKLLTAIPRESILTPHTGEFDRLFGVHQNDEERIMTAQEKAREYQIIIALKGPQTKIITAEDVWYNATGNAGLAKGGSGDALTGIITSFLAQGYSPLNAVKLGVYLHGSAADITLTEQSVESMIITDVIENIGKAFAAIRVK